MRSHLLVRGSHGETRNISGSMVVTEKMADDDSVKANEKPQEFVIVID